TAVATELGANPELARRDRVGAGENEPHKDKPNNRPHDQRTIGTSREAAATAAAKPCAAPTQEFVERGNIRSAKSGSPCATSGFTPGTVSLAAAGAIAR